ncbi:MAG: hypothetical protein IT168_03005 [Bryobacterales bacterium]|nr:hypothetical protein [Bryobacterales bacterium]
MPLVSSAATLRDGFAKPIVQALFWASCLLSVVSFYTTQQGMALYLSSWFSIVAALGIQLSLVLVAWLIGFTRKGKALLIAVYAMTAIVSVAFSYVSLYTWFAARERPAVMQRTLYDELTGVAAKADQVLSEAIANGRRYTLALEEMTAAEKSHGQISRARDGEPYLDNIREKVSREAQTYRGNYREGAGEGVRYTAFDRHAKLTRQMVEELSVARHNLERQRSALKPDMPTEQQLRRFHEAYDSIPWASAEQLLSNSKLERPAAPAYANYVERSGSGQEDLMRAFQELFTAPTSRHALSFGLAAFIDVIVFLLAFSAGPYFYGDPEQRWYSAAAALDATDDQVFVGTLLRKLQPGRQGMPRVNADDLSAGEQQLCMLLVNKGLAVTERDGERVYYLLDPVIHEKMLESLNGRGMAFRAASTRAAAV